MNNLLVQAAHSTLLPEDLSKLQSWRGQDASLPVDERRCGFGHRLYGTLHAVTVGDPQPSWAEKRAARVSLAVAFLAGMAVVDQGER